MKPDYATLRNLVNIDSPSGYTHEALAYIKTILDGYGFKSRFTNKGALICSLSNLTPTITIAAHVDTLGAIVSGINKNGTLSFSTIGGLSLSSAEGEYVKIITMSGRAFTGTLLLNDPSSHANNERENDKRSIRNMHVRIDEVVDSRKEAMAHGIRNGDFICFDPRYTETESGFIKSRFMDNKAGCFVLLEIARLTSEGKLNLPAELLFSNYEETGHGASGGYAPTIKELLVIDMGVVGEACEGNEISCSICVKDSSGPYDFHFRKELVEICEKEKINFKLDVYPFYSSDGSAALKAGNDFKTALIGPGVAASHGVERTHKRGIEATIELCMKYLTNKYL